MKYTLSPLPGALLPTVNYTLSNGKPDEYATITIHANQKPAANPIFMSAGKEVGQHWKSDVSNVHCDLTDAPRSSDGRSRGSL